MTDPADRCPKCGAEEDDNVFMRYEKHMRCGTRLVAAQGGTWEVAWQSDRCRIAELEREVERLKDHIKKLKTCMETDAKLADFQLTELRLDNQRLQSALRNNP